MFASSYAFREAEVDFGAVEVGKTATRSIEIYNESCMELSYEVQRDPLTSPLEESFTLRNYSWRLAPDKKFLCEIRYRPLFAFCESTDYFYVRDSSEDCIKIVAHGSSIGPKVTASSTKLTMICPNESRESKKRIKLKNDSNVTALYMFDMDNSSSPFRVDKTHGSIGPCSFGLVTITFTPVERRKYSYFLYCLILHSEPILFELYGYHGPAGFREDETRGLGCQWKPRKGFDGFMRECITTREHIPPVSLSKNYLDFGQTNFGNSASVPHVVSVTNHSESTVTVKWQKEADGIFELAVDSMRLKPGQSSLVEIRFRPNARSNFFSRDLIASVFGDEDFDKESSAFPFVTWVRAIGHSFPTESYGWTPQYEIPQAISMPACLPSFPVRRTFVIKKLGHLPLMFRFDPPTPSRFCLRPMLGVIHQDYQVIVVQMTPKPDDQQFYMERWLIHLNGNRKNEIYIDFKGYAEYPRVMFCEKNLITFPPVYPGCKQLGRIEIRNVTRHTIRYQFSDLPVELEPASPNGLIRPNEILRQEWFFRPLSENMDYDFDLQYVQSTVGAQEIETGGSVRVTGTSEKGTLMAVPSELDFGVQEYNNKKILSFYLFNLSVVSVPYKISMKHRGWPIGDLERDVKIRPSISTVPSGGYEMIYVSITPKTVGLYQFSIGYSARVEVATNEEFVKDICTIDCACVLPVLKVNSLRSHGINPNVTSFSLWKSLNIEKLNKYLEDILPGETKTIDLNFIPATLNEESCVKFVLNNSANVDATWKLKLMSTCSSKSNRKSGADVHKKLCSVEPTSISLKSKERAELNVKIKHELAGETIVKWNLDAGHDRHIVLNISIESLTESDRKLHMLYPSMDFGRVYIGNRDAVYQTHWIHNFTHHSLPYSIDSGKLCEVNNASDCGIFYCKTRTGVVGPRSMEPIMIKFRPRFFGSFETVLSVNLGDAQTHLELRGEASCEPKSTTTFKSPAISQDSEDEEFPVHFSVELIEVRLMGTYNRLIRMVLIRNDLKHDAIGYEWGNREIPGVIRVKIHPRKGVIQAKMTQSFRVEIDSAGCPCEIDLTVPCEFVNATDKRDYNRSVLKHETLEKELNGQFDITEKGTHFSENWVKVLEKPRVYCKTITIYCRIRNPETEADLMTELQTLPYLTIETINNQSKKCIIKEDKELLICNFILERMMWEIVTGATFRNTIADTLLVKNKMRYSQFVTDLSEQRKLVRRSYISPPPMYIDAILENMLFVIVHEEFALETVHLIPEEDIRRTNYLKMTSRDRPSLSRRGIRKLPEEGTISSITKLRSKATVSFTQDF